MSSENGPSGLNDNAYPPAPVRLHQTIECQLFESLVHHLIEKGVLTRNDALSVVQTVASVKRGALEEQYETVPADEGLATLKRLYSSFELISDRRVGAHSSDDENVLQLRPPLHGDRPQFEEN